VIIVAVTAAYRVYLSYVGTSSQGVSVARANRMLWPHLRLPDAASDVSYYVDFGAAEAEFTVPQQEFLNWCQAKGWDCRPITSTTPYFEPMAMTGDPRPVTKGYCFFPPDGQGVFDANQSRACFWVSTFP
jgi:hypothetical protein